MILLLWFCDSRCKQWTWDECWCSFIDVPSFLMLRSKENFKSVNIFLVKRGKLCYIENKRKSEKMSKLFGHFWSSFEQNIYKIIHFTNLFCSFNYHVLTKGFVKKKNKQKLLPIQMILRTNVLCSWFNRCCISTRITIENFFNCITIKYLSLLCW